MDYYFEVKGLTVGYHKQPLIHDIEFHIQSGEILTLIGPNGSGKSTILKSISKQLETLAGTVYIGKEELHSIDYKSLAKQLAVVLTERVRPEMMRCHDVVALGRYPYTGHLGILSEEDEDVIQNAMEQVHVSEIMNRDFMAISDGQRQRVMLARAICQQPKVIILDEPTSFLDIRHKVELLTILRTMAREQKTTIIMSLHEIDLAQKISDQILCVKGDVCEYYGTPEEIFRDHIIEELYEIPENLYNLQFGNVELVLDQPAENAKKIYKEESGVFVISSAGNGIETFRKLSRMGVPFCAGIIYENDLDYPVAHALAKEVVTERAFEPISERTLQEAKQMIDRSESVIVCNLVIGSQNARIQELIDYANEQGKLAVMEGNGEIAKH